MAGMAPDGEILGAVQIVHGMMEHAHGALYRETAEWLADRGDRCRLPTIWAMKNGTAAGKRGSGILWRQGWELSLVKDVQKADALWKKEMRRLFLATAWAHLW